MTPVDSEGHDELARGLKGVAALLGFPLALALFCTTDYAHETARCQLTTCFLNRAGLASLVVTVAVLSAIAGRWVPVWLGTHLLLVLTLAAANVFAGSVLLENGVVEHGWWRMSLSRRLAFFEGNILYSVGFSAAAILGAAVFKRPRRADLYGYLILVSWGYLVAGLSRMASLLGHGVE